MGKLSLQDLADVLVEKNGLSKQEALHFVSSVFDAVQDGLQKEKLVKIKGLGTFKVIEVEARESVNVNTGERVVIGSHSKITFIPDVAMKELVNKPFSGFETVALNDGVSFDDVSSTDVAEKEQGEEEPASKPDVSAVKLAEVPDVPKEEEPKEEKPAEDETDTYNNYGMTEKQKKRKWLWPMLFVLGCGASFYGGFKMSRMMDPTAIYQNIDTVLPVDSIIDSVQVANNSPVETAKVENSQSTKTEDIKTKNDNTKTEAKPADDDHEKYEKMDARVRTGAYRIVGLDRVIKSNVGETLGYIAGRILGPDMVCYLEVYNGMKDSNKALEVGTEIKIPKLELKKKKTAVGKETTTKKKNK